MTNPKINIIAAMDEKRGIGKHNKIPWHLKEDLIKLKDLTKGKLVVLGRKTYDSMTWYYNKSGRQMPGQLYIVVTRDKEYQPEQHGKATTAGSIDEAIEKAKLIGDDEVFVIGGQQIFEQTVSKARRLYLTIVKGDFDADTFFPDYSVFTKVVSKEEHFSGDYEYIFLTLEK